MAVWMWAGHEKNYPLLQYLSSYKYIYWSTPKLRGEIRLGDGAYIWRHKKGSNLSPGVIAVGEVVELPKPARQILHPEYLEESWWHGMPASDWKTGIVISDLRWDSADGMLDKDTLLKTVSDLNVLRNPRGTIFRVSDQQHQQLQRLWAQRVNS